ncbi:hypothetical protein L914_15834 [Phytophthora nicotianae]|uniref:Uncharacterized protein n=1 Tax=Phytophthora nicotianae TaxID=4792 RepID=W2MMM9_PHYNI|nr:hypothetical protein L914_15834 [Phytophthora nicotianae]
MASLDTVVLQLPSSSHRITVDLLASARDRTLLLMCLLTLPLLKSQAPPPPRSAGQGGIKAKLTSHDFAGVDVKSLSSWDESPDEGSKKSDDDNENKDKENEIASKADKKRRRKFFFDQKADLALLKEMLANEPFAGGHGKIGARYQLVTDNLSAHLKLDQKLSKRTVQERFTLLLDEFKQNDQAYRKKT